MSEENKDKVAETFLEDVQVASDEGLLDGQAQAKVEGNNSEEKDSEETTGADHSLDSDVADADGADESESFPVDASPNVIFIGTKHRNGKVERLTEAPDNLISGPSTFEGLPNSEEQLKGFYYERAAELCSAFPGLYKRITKKGE